MRLYIVRVLLKVLERFGLSFKNYGLTVNRQKSDIENFKINLQAGEAKYFTFQGREKLIVPVVMLRQTVVNESLVTIDELRPETWNGVPVTLNHPTDERGDFVSANSPEMVLKFQIGTIFKARMDEDKLKAEAWLDIETLKERDKDLLSNLESGVDMDVSTGYFSERIQQNGTFEGKEYFDLAKNIQPDHLALLPYSEGACSFEDGCGVRSNKILETIQHFVSNQKDSRIENFLSTLRDKFLKQNDGSEIDQLQELISNVIEALQEKEVKNMGEKSEKLEVKKQDCNCDTLSKEDKDALEFAKNFYQERKDSLVSKLKANGFEEKELEGFKVAQLEIMANKFEKTETKEVKANGETKEADSEKVVQPNFQGRGVAQKKVSSNKVDYSQLAENTKIGAFKKGSK